MPLSFRRIVWNTEQIFATFIARSDSECGEERTGFRHRLRGARTRGSEPYLPKTIERKIIIAIGSDSRGSVILPDGHEIVTNGCVTPVHVRCAMNVPFIFVFEP